MKHLLNVYLYGNLTGTLKLNSGSMLFNYSDVAKKPLSLSMPINSNKYTNKACEAFFGGLLPEGVDTIKSIVTAVGASSQSTFSLIEQIGVECAGAVIISKPEVSPDLRLNFEVRGKKLTDAELAEMLTNLPRRPLFIDKEFRISLAGAQHKGALCMIDGNLVLPEPGVPTTHILKPSINHPDTPDTVENEFYCMRLSNLVGLKTPQVQYREAESVKYLLVTRFDRLESAGLTNNREVRRIHQEDFCQALGFLSSKKYETDGGPSLVTCFKLIDRMTYPAKDKIELLKRVIFNYVIGNKDAHSKNFSLLHHTNNTLELSPTYDVMSTVVYPKVNTKLAMSIGRESEINRIKAENWLRLCEKIDVSPANFKRISFEIMAKVEAELPEIRSQMLEGNIWVPVCEEIEAAAKTRMSSFEVSLNKM